MVDLMSQCESQLPVEAIEFFFAAHRAVALSSSSSSPSSSLSKATAALDNFRQDATNLPIDDEILAESKSALCEALAACDLLQPTLKLFEKRLTVLAASKPEAISAINSGAVFVNKNAQEQVMQEVISRVFISGYWPAQQRDVLTRAGITSLLCCFNFKPCFPREFEYLQLDANDRPEQCMSQFFDESFDFINSALGRGGAVLVFCGAGISRSATICAAFLIRTLRIPVDEAIAMLQRARPCAAPNDGFKKQLEIYSYKFR